MKNLYFMSFIYLLSMSMVLFVMSLYFIFNNLIYIIEWEIISINSMMIIFSMLFDWMSLMFMSFVLMISSMVVKYSESYMMEDFNKNRFLLLVLMFVFSMMMMIISPNLISILLGWDGLGLVSYCLVVYYQNVKSYNAGMLTVLMNRIGDVTLLISISWMMNYGSWNYLFYMKYMMNNFEMILIMFLILISAMTKSAQIPFSSWLPAAMAAPTPVSALVHSSTLVTAGVYLMIRFSELLMKSNLFIYLLLISTLTMFMSGLGANYEFDLKKIIALSTLSQLGLMMSSLSFNMPKLAFFHLLMHALFKALLFMCSGIIIHLLNNFQDIRLMGGMSNMMIMLGSIISLANLALCGFPFLAGFYSKDLILESLSSINFNFLIYLLFYFSIGLTVCYSFRLSSMLFFNSFNYFSLNFLNDEFNKMIKMSFILMIFSLCFGKIMINLIFYIPNMFFISFMMKIMVMIMFLLGLWVGLEISYYKIGYNYFNKKKLVFFGNMWFLPVISVFYIYKPLIYGNNLMKIVDQGWLEFMGSQNLFLNYSLLSKNYNKYQMNMMMIYLISMFFWVVYLLILYF
uniref:NADH-ubiquinone oxidoreductase chain 5 n=1 Tax=Ctenocephalides felis TaxID=7515 RepID=A0A7D5UFH6_CTEFE|nr:NADH dehydrogenase subunit 5 [Ctenocephalides felis]QLI54057.1 NADH dehydrogenase subunit 5 [Ctenocephalides felis]